MYEALIQAAATIFQPYMLLLILVVGAIGILIGLIPGLSGMIGMALFLPLVFKLPPEIALVSLVAMHAVTFTGGSISAILLNIPGTPANAATLIDGFPLTQKGEGSRAVAAAVTASGMGGIISVFLSLLMIPLVIPIVMAFKSAEMTFVILLGLSCLAIIGSGSAIKGVIAAGVGMILSLIGFHMGTWIPRFTFGTSFLHEGLDVIAVCLGLFGLPEVVEIVAKRETTLSKQTSQKARYAGILQGVLDIWHYKWTFLLSTVIGFLSGVVPGVGAEAATFVSYAQAKQLSKNRDDFGKGCIEGVIAPEAANNAKDGGALLTTLAFGIPGSSVMAILLAAFLMVGVTPGPRMLVDHLDLSLTLLLGMVVSNLIFSLVCLLFTPHLVRLVGSIHIDFVFPVVVGFIVIGAYIAVESMLNLLVLFIFGILGLFMKRYGYSRPALLLTFILGGLFEYYLLHALQFNGPWFFITPISLILIAIVICLFSFPYLKKVYK